MSLKEDIQPFIKGEIENDEQVLNRYSRDASLFSVKPAAVVFPAGARDIKQLVLFATKHTAQNISLTARSAGTDMTGGPLTESIVVDVSRHFTAIKRIGGQFATVEPGVFYRDFEATTLKHNLLLPSYPASKDICTVGGMVANNAGGEKTLAYGKTANYVCQLKTIIDDGKEYSFRPLSRRELQEKMSLKTREGDIYRQLFQLVDQNFDLLKSAKPKVSKNSAGYALWDVWDKQCFDVTNLLTGSQGTLGIITEITFRLVTPKPYSQMLVIFLKDLGRLADIIKTTLTYQPESFESYDDHTLTLALRFLPSLIQHMKGNALKLAWQFLPELTMMITGGPPKLILLAEFTGFNQHEVDIRAQAAKAALAHLSVSTRVTKSANEVQKYWAVRRESFNLLRRHTKNKRAAPFIDDFVVRPQQLPQFLPQLGRIMSEYDITYTIAGHAGDANFHIIPLLDTSRPDASRIIQELGQKVYNLVFKFGGSITGEHNDGLIRSHYLEQMYGEKVYQLFQETKRIFDPHNIFNPGKKVNADPSYAYRHLIKEN